MSLGTRRVVVDGGVRCFEPVTDIGWYLIGSNQVQKQFHIGDFILNSFVVLKLKHIYRTEKVVLYFTDVFVEFQQGALSERVYGSASRDFNSCSDSVGNGSFAEFLALTLQLLNLFAAVFDRCLDVLDQASFIYLKFAIWQGLLEGLQDVSETFKLLDRFDEFGVLLFVRSIEIDELLYNLDP